MVRLGSGYGGWWIQDDKLGADAVVYSAGVGEDITFDVDLINRYGCAVVGLDPTPRAIAYVAERAPDGFRLEPIGLGGSDRTARFYSPADQAHVSHSIVNLQATAEFFEAPLERLSTVMGRLGHDHIDLLKMDIEGAEHEVIENMAAESIWPTMLCVEFDQVLPTVGLRRSLAALRHAGYGTVKVENRNMTFVRSTG
jgi:FkbM family methyltransferase